MQGQAWKAGARVAGYELERELGRGGMGVVYAARHLETGELRAIKTLLLGAEEKAVERFRREGQAQAKVDRHPNVARVHSAGEAFGRAYLVLDLVSCGDLKERLKASGPLAPEDAARLAAHLGRGLAHAHTQGVLHRDLKPANVLFDASDAPKLIDFGLARLLGEGTLTRTGEFLGTPAYMAPEQVDDARAVDARADVYGLGGILFSALTGEVPFPGSTAPEILRGVFMEQIRAPSSLRPEIPRALDAIVQKAMAKAPERRHANAEALVAELEAFLAGRTLQPQPRWRWGLALGVLVALGVGLGLAQRPEDAPPERRQETARHRPSAPATPAPPPRWQLNPGKRYRYAFEWQENNDKGFLITIKGHMDWEVLAIEEGSYRLRSTLVLSELSGTNSRGVLARLRVPKVACDEALGRAEFTCLLDPLSGAIREPAGLEGIREAIKRKSPPTAFDLDREQPWGQYLVNQVYSDTTTGRHLALVTHLLAGSPWRARRGQHQLRVRARKAPLLPILFAEPKPGEIFGLTGTATFEGGRLRVAEVEQVGTHALRATYRASLRTLP